MRKNLLLPLAFIFFANISKAQFKKGSTLLGGDISFSTQNIKYMNTPQQKSHAFSITPVFAKATKENLFWGGSLSFGSTESVYNINGEAKGQAYYAGVFLRRYMPIHGKFNAFFQAGVNGGYLISKASQGSDYNARTETFTLYASVTPGISVNVSKRFFLEAGFSNIASIVYSNGKQTENNFGNRIDQKLSSFGFSTSLSTNSGGLFFGTRFILPG